ncbi:radical SAM family heme chaperone HemW [Prochlorococcus marinus]|uniref:Heme chaperone HemW n=1 Tax=Prochlorococcus marinus (strain MIT 9211) TaxID=93059 RepID=A9BBS8_PROM4|nr:radical SAM family heme chaperone HemW [Prochlorococcus marinus]ABX09290.1 Putative oxygen-independent coproporphyrinogen III oxidase [Prochlorococcus marinus str. MIT 9211]
MKEPRSAYLHIPFCHRRCFYCDFPIVPLGDKARGEGAAGSKSIKSYLKLLFREISLAPQASPLSTVYIGGGTPSLLTPNQLGDLLQHLFDHFGLQDGAEVTVEVDPASFNEEDLREYLEIGITRLSLGAQSFDNEALSMLGRRHDSSQLFDSCQWIKKAYSQGNLFSWSLDLIQNLPKQNLFTWEQQLKKLLEISPPHLSIYDLSIEEGTVFAWRQSRGELNLPSDEFAADITSLTSSILQEAGYSRYEISNFALPGHTSRHNRVYWSGARWWGFGLGATSCPWGKRLERPKTRAAYEAWLLKQELEGIDKSLLPTNQSSIDLDELFLVGLRRREGINFEEMAIEWGWDQTHSNIFLKELENHWNGAIEKGWLKRQGKRFVLTDPVGMNVSNQVLVEMLLWWDSLPKSAVAQPSF